MLTLIITSFLVIYGITMASTPWMILEWIKEFIILNFHKEIAMPLIACIYCMSSAWTIFTYIVLRTSGVIDLPGWVLFAAIPAVCGLIVITKKFIPSPE